MSNALAPTDVFSPSTEQRQLIRETFAPGSTDPEFRVLMAVAERRNLDPFLRQIFFVKRYNSQTRTETWAHQVSIDGLRAIAERTGKYDGQDEPEYEVEGAKIILCKVKVYRKDWSRPAVGVAYWAEYAQTNRDGKVTSMWAKFPRVMLAKCAEALALRKAFPEGCGGLYTPDEMPSDTREQATHPPATARAIVPRPEVRALARKSETPNEDDGAPVPEAHTLLGNPVTVVGADETPHRLAILRAADQTALTAVGGTFKPLPQKTKDALLLVFKPMQLVLGNDPAKSAAAIAGIADLLVSFEEVEALLPRLPGIASDETRNTAKVALDNAVTRITSGSAS